MFFGLHLVGAFCNLIFPPPSSILVKNFFWCFFVLLQLFLSECFLGVLLETGCLSSVVESAWDLCQYYFLCNTICYKDGPACFSYSVQLSCSCAQKFAAILAYWVEQLNTLVLSVVMFSCWKMLQMRMPNVCALAISCLVAGRSC